MVEEKDDLWTYREPKHASQLYQNATYCRLTPEDHSGVKAWIVSSSSNIVGDKMVVKYVFSDGQVKTKEFKGENKDDGMVSYCFMEREEMPDDLEFDPEFEKKLEELIIRDGFDFDEEELKAELENPTGKEIKSKDGFETIKITPCEEI